MSEHDLPPLPAPKTTARELVGIGECDFYSADQMRAYALAAVQAEREACAKLCENATEDSDDSLMGAILAQVIRERGES